MASWFSEGTVSVQSGSPTVTGVGTKFSNCRSGDMFVGPDQGIYQVINPASDTSLSISPAYRGAAVGGAGYGIVPVNGYPKALADAVNQMVQQWGATLAGLGDVSAQDIVPVTMGGTGAATAPAARAALGLGTASVKAVGVSLGNIQDVGAPAAIIGSSVFAETGSHFIAYGDDTLGAPAGGAYWSGIRAQYPFQAAAIDIVGQVLGPISTNLMFRSVGGTSDAPVGGPWRKMYHDGNTTRAADGTLKAI